MKTKLEPWLLYSMLAALCWGVWGVVAKLISDQVSPFTNHLLFSAGMLLTLPFVVRKTRMQPTNRRGIGWGLVAGALAVTGNVAVYQAFSVGGLAAIVIPVTNLYPLVTIGIALLVFREKLNWINGIGLLLTIPAVLLLSGESLLFDDPMAFVRSFGTGSGTDRRWLLYAGVALVFWGLFSAAQKQTTNFMSAEWAYVSFIGASVLIAGVFMGLGLTNLHLSARTWGLGTLAGLLNGLGVLASFAAYSAEGKAAKVTTIAGALQPVFTIVLALLVLGENLSWLEALGIVLAVAGALTLSYEGATPEPRPLAKSV